MRILSLFFLITAIGVIPCGVLANPTNPSLQSGSATFSGSGNTLLIHQGSDRIIVDWETFSIQRGETTQFIQPGSSSAALNRVTSGNPSEIYGNLQANGRVLLINPNGILVGPTGQIDTAGFLASTLDVSDSDFLRGEDMTFEGDSRAKILNFGTINAIDGGDIFLIARTVENYGTLNAPGGTVGLAAGSRVMVKSEAMGERISILPGSESGSVTNGTSGVVNAAIAELKAAGGNEYALAINNDGLVRANRFENRGGKIYLGARGKSRVRNRGIIKAPGGKVKASAGTVENSGTIDAGSEVGNGGGIEIEAESVIGKVGGFLNTTGLQNGGSVKITASGELRIDEALTAVGEKGFGGSIRLSGDQVTLGDQAQLDASGATGGGTILVGGGRAGRDDSIANARFTTIEDGAEIFADATGSKGEGGTVILWADDTMDFRGNVRNRGAVNGAGGFTEVSGLQQLGFHGTVDTGGGNLLLDPFNYVIGGGEAAAIVAALGMNHVTIDTTADAGALGSSGTNTDAGDITVNSDIFYDSPHDLTFLAVGDIHFHASVQNRNETGGDLNIVAGWDGATAFNAASFAAVNVRNGNVPTPFGNGVGSVQIGDGTQTEEIAVGSRSGSTSVFGYDFRIQGGNGVGDNRFAQLGFHAVDGIALDGTDLDPANPGGANVTVGGEILLQATNDIIVRSGDTSSLNSALIGHTVNVSTGASIGGTGPITLNSGGSISFFGGPSAPPGYTGIGSTSPGGSVSVTTGGGSVSVTTGGGTPLVGIGNFGPGQGFFPLFPLPEVPVVQSLPAPSPPAVADPIFPTNFRFEFVNDSELEIITNKLLGRETSVEKEGVQEEEFFSGFTSDVDGKFETDEKGNIRFVPSDSSAAGSN